MILDFVNFTRKGLMVDHVSPEEIGKGGGGGTKHGKNRGCKTRKEAVEDGETPDLSVM